MYSGDVGVGSICKGELCLSFPLCCVVAPAGAAFAGSYMYSGDVGVGSIFEGEVN
jgi:hypothetical protein